MLAACRTQAGGRRLLEKKPVAKVAAAATPGQKMYMVVGFEVVACSIKRTPGEPINKNLICPQTLDEPNAPEPQEVKKGEGSGSDGSEVGSDVAG